MNDKIANTIVLSEIVNKVIASEIVHTMMKQFSPYIMDHISYLSQMTGKKYRLAKVPFMKDGENTLIVRFVPAKRKMASNESYILTITYISSNDTYNITPTHIPELGPVQKAITLEDMYFDSFGSPDIFWHGFKGKE